MHQLCVQKNTDTYIANIHCAKCEKKISISISYDLNILKSKNVNRT